MSYATGENALLPRTACSGRAPSTRCARLAARYARSGRRRAERDGGFTLIELLVVVAIIGILAAVAVGQYQRAIIKAKEAVLRENLFIMRTQISLYFADKARYPSDLNALVADKYMRAVPVDPITESADTWITEYAELDDADISTEPGIADVRSGAGGTSLDGTSYAEW